MEIRYNRAHATLMINKSGVNLTGGNTSEQVLITLPDGVKLNNTAVLGKIAPILDSSWTPTGDYITLVWPSCLNVFAVASTPALYGVLTVSSPFST